MKNCFGALLVIVTGLFIFSSCQREISEEQGQIVTSSDSVYLSKMIYLDTTLPPGVDTAGKAVFTYDIHKRLTRIVHFEVGSTDTVKEELFYLGNDTLPYKQVYHDIYTFAGPAHYVDTIFYTYNNGFVARDSLIEWELIHNGNSGATVTEFTNVSNGVIERTKYYDLVAGNYVLDHENFNTILISRASGNIISQTDTSSSPTYIVSAQVSYDTKVNPLSKVFKVNNPDFQFLNGDGWDLQKNNVLHLQWVSAATGSPQEEQRTYVYRSDNYPLICRIRDITNNRYYKILYSYTPL